MRNSVRFHDRHLKAPAQYIQASLAIAPQRKVCSRYDHDDPTTGDRAKSSDATPRGKRVARDVAGQAAAEDTQLTQQPFQISLGSFTNSSEITIRADGENQEGTEFDWGDTIGDVDGTTFRLDSYWRINDRHHVRFMYTENSSKRTKILDREIEWNGELIPIDASVESDFGFYVVEVASTQQLAEFFLDLLLVEPDHMAHWSAENSVSRSSPRRPFSSSRISSKIS